MRLIGNVEKDAQVRAVASGALPSGDAVVVNSDGTVSVIAGNDASAGTPTVYNAASQSEMSAAFDSTNNKVVVVYKDNGNSQRGTAAVGTVSGTSISFGSEVVFNTGVMGNVTSTAYDSNAQKIVIAYKNESNSFYGEAIVGTVSGTSISFGTAVVFSSATTSNTTAVFDSTNNKVVVSYAVASNGKARVGTVSGTSISFGTEVTFNPSNSGPISSTFDSTNGKVIIAFRDGGNSDYGTAVVGTVSGTSISFGSEAVFGSATTNQHTIGFDANAGKVVIAYQDGNASNQGKLVVGTVSGTSISYGTAINLNPTGEAEQFAATYDSTAQKVVIAYKDKGNSSQPTFGFCTVSGTSVSVENSVVVTAGSVGGVVYDSSANKLVLDYTNSDGHGAGVVFSPASTNLTSENFLGFAAHTYADTQSALVNSTCTVDRNQTSLTAGQTYYVQTDGSLGTTAADPSVVAGTAISSTEIIVKG
jgi:hypothetical protein